METIKNYSSYKVDQFGNVFNKNGHKMKPFTNKKGYDTVTLTNESGKQKSLTVHRLVAKAYLEAIPGKTHVNHIDSNKLNNSVSNLEWCTNKENIEHAVLSGTHDSKGVKNCKSVLNESGVFDIRQNTANLTVKELANKHNVSVYTIYRVINKTAWRHL